MPEYSMLSYDHNDPIFPKGKLRKRSASESHAQTCKKPHTSRRESFPEIYNTLQGTGHQSKVTHFSHLLHI